MIQNEMKRMKLHVVVSNKLSHFECSQRCRVWLKRLHFGFGGVFGYLIKQLSTKLTNHTREINGFFMGMPQNLEDFSYLRLGVRMEFVKTTTMGVKYISKPSILYVAWATRTMLNIFFSQATPLGRVTSSVRNRTAVSSEFEQWKCLGFFFLYGRQH